ncbi:MAG: sugar nucleotide-binding protein [Burkholderiales bacterium]|nr:sugar nucleotide-binding protein [Burkholderiales bacterium]
MRLLPMLCQRFRVFAVTSQPPTSERFHALRHAGAIPLVADLDQPASLRRLAGLAQVIVHLAPPQTEGHADKRTRRLAAILPEKARLVYISTTGVYGDGGGTSFDETRPVKPANARAQRRVSAETSLRNWARRRSGHLSILRVPGIYAEDRLPLERIKKGSPALLAEDDVFSNHIHADDLAYLIFLACFRGSANRVYHAVDDSELKMADYFDLVADHFELARVPRMSRAELTQCATPLTMSFMSESRRLKNDRIKRELAAKLRFPTVQATLVQMRDKT